MSVPSLKQPSAFLPSAMSLATLVLVLGHAAIFGIVHDADEGTAAHVFQLLLAAQTPLVAFFALRWLAGHHDGLCRYSRCRLVPLWPPLSPPCFSRSGRTGRRGRQDARLGGSPVARGCRPTSVPMSWTSVRQSARR